MSDTAPALEPLLSLRGVSRAFGALRAVDDVTLTVREGERRALIGPNGAGKSTLLKLITGQLSPTSGAVEFLGEDVTARREHQRARLGLAMTFQHSNLFDDLSVRENVGLAVQRHLGIASRWYAPTWRDSTVTDRAEQLLEQMNLAHMAHRRADELAHGERRRLEITLSRASEPRLLLLDEPVAGMSPGEIEDFLALLTSIDDLTFVIIEHNIDVVLRLATSVTVLDAGRVIAEGSPTEIASSAVVQAAYLGTEPGEELFAR